MNIFQLQRELALGMMLIQQPISYPIVVLQNQTTVHFNMAHFYFS